MRRGVHKRIAVILRSKNSKCRRNIALGTFQKRCIFYPHGFRIESKGRQGVMQGQDVMVLMFSNSW